MTEIIIVVIVLVGLLVLGLICGVISYFLAKRRYPKVEEELAKLVEYEQERGRKLSRYIKGVLKRGFKFDKEATRVILEGIDSLPSMSMQERSLYKNMCDFSAKFIVKIANEDARYKDFLTEDEKRELDSYPEDSEQKYKAYNKVAGLYNAMFHMPFCRTIVRLTHSTLKTATLM